MTRRDSTQESGKINFRTTAMPERACLCQEKLSLVLFRTIKIPTLQQNELLGGFFLSTRKSGKIILWPLVRERSPTETLGVTAHHGENEHVT